MANCSHLFLTYLILNQKNIIQEKIIFFEENLSDVYHWYQMDEHFHHFILMMYCYFQKILNHQDLLLMIQSLHDDEYDQHVL